MILLLLFIVIAADDRGSLERGVFFHEKTKTLLTEKFVNNQILVPYPKFNIEPTKNLGLLAAGLQSMWRMPAYRCYLNFTNTSGNDFKVDRLLKETKKEVLFADKDLTKIKQVSFINGTSIKEKRSKRTTDSSRSSKRRRTNRIMFGASDNFGLMGIFGS